MCPTLCDPQGLQPIRLLRPWDFPGKSAGVDCHFLLQEIFLTQELNSGLPHCRQTLYRLSHQGSLKDGIVQGNIVLHNQLDTSFWVLLFLLLLCFSANICFILSLLLCKSQKRRFMQKSGFDENWYEWVNYPKTSTLKLLFQIAFILFIKKDVNYTTI